MTSSFYRFLSSLICIVFIPLSWFTEIIYLITFQWLWRVDCFILGRICSTAFDISAELLARSTKIKFSFRQANGDSFAETLIGRLNLVTKADEGEIVWDFPMPPMVVDLTRN